MGISPKIRMECLNRQGLIFCKVTLCFKIRKNHMNMYPAAEKMWKMELCPLRLTYFKKCRPGTIFTWLWLLHAPKYSEICQSDVQTTTQSTLMGSNFDNMDILQIIQQYLSNNIFKSFYLVSKVDLGFLKFSKPLYS